MSQTSHSQSNLVNRVRKLFVLLFLVAGFVAMTSNPGTKEVLATVPPLCCTACHEMCDGQFQNCIDACADQQFPPGGSWGQCINNCSRAWNSCMQLCSDCDSSC